MTTGTGLDCEYHSSESLTVRNKLRTNDGNCEIGRKVVEVTVTVFLYLYACCVFAYVCLRVSLYMRLVFYLCKHFVMKLGQERRKPSSENVNMKMKWTEFLERI